jgi:Na+/melibiose symporter-like transporter
MIPNMEVLGSLVRDLHQMLSNLFYLALPLAIVLSVCIGFFKGETPSYADILRRALVASLLLISFPEISGWILDICDGVAGKIDSMSGLETFMRMAEEKSRSYAGAQNVLLLKFNDLFIAVLSFASYIILYIARYLTIALYYFFWVMLSVLSPILILCYMFPATAGITKGLYRGLIEVASWKIIWAIQSAMLAALSVGNIYKTEGSYITLIVLNFVIAIGLLCTPMLVKSIVGDGLQSAASTMGTAAAAAMLTLPTRAVKVTTISRDVLSNSYNYFSSKFK